VEDLLLEVVIGLGAGVLSGLLGVGGGAIMVPAMVLLLGVEQHQAQGASLAVIALVATVATLTNLRAGYVSPRQVAWIALPAIVAALVGSGVAGLLDEETLRRIYAILLGIIALHTIVSALRMPPAREPLTIHPPESDGPEG
jgi:uncharacterized membrane protein YfcA